jgi:hypothetical protein
MGQRPRAAEVRLGHTGALRGVVGAGADDHHARVRRQAVAQQRHEQEVRQVVDLEGQLDAVLGEGRAARALHARVADDRLDRAVDGGGERAHRPERAEVELVAPGRHDVPARGAHRGGRLAPEAARGAGDEHAHRKPSTTLNGV